MTIFFSISIFILLFLFPQRSVEEWRCPWVLSTEGTRNKSLRCVTCTFIVIGINKTYRNYDYKILYVNLVYKWFWYYIFKKDHVKKDKVKYNFKFYHWETKYCLCICTWQILIWRFCFTLGQGRCKGHSVSVWECSAWEVQR